MCVCVCRFYKVLCVRVDFVNCVCLYVYVGFLKYMLCVLVLNCERV